MEQPKLDFNINLKKSEFMDIIKRSLFIRVMKGVWGYVDYKII